MLFSHWCFCFILLVSTFAIVDACFSIFADDTSSSDASTTVKRAVRRLWTGLPSTRRENRRFRHFPTTTTIPSTLYDDEYEFDEAVKEFNNGEKVDTLSKVTPIKIERRQMKTRKYEEDTTTSTASSTYETQFQSTSRKTTQKTTVHEVSSQKLSITTVPKFYDDKELPEMKTADNNNVEDVKDSEKKEVLCYFTSWSQWRSGFGRFTAADVDLKLCTRILYAFLVIDDANDGLKFYDPAEIYLRDEKVWHGIDPSMPIVASVGGWNAASYSFTSIANNATRRHRFNKRLIPFLRKYRFGGIDFDWEYPAKRGGVASDKTAFAEWLKELRILFDRDGAVHHYLPKLTLSAAVKATPVDDIYDVAVMAKTLDWIGLMTYDFVHSGSASTGHNSPLHSTKDGNDGELEATSVSDSVRRWLAEGVPRNRLIVGVPLYGHNYRLEDSTDNGVGAVTNGTGRIGNFTRQQGIVGFNEISLRRRCASNAPRVIWDTAAKVPYLVEAARNEWTTFDDPMSVGAKARFVVAERLSGVMVWSLDTDDFNRVAGFRETFPLLRTINAALKSDHQWTRHTIDNIESDVNVDPCVI